MRGRSRDIETALLVCAVVNLLCIEAWPGWQSVPAHLSLIAFTVGYWAAAWWPLRHAVLGVLAVVGAAAALWAAERGHGSGVDGAEAVLLTAMVVVTVLRALNRRRARRILGGLSHEILTAMTVIRGHLEILGRRRAASTTEIAEVREIVIDELDRLEHRLDGLDQIDRAADLDVGEVRVSAAPPRRGVG